MIVRLLTTCILFATSFLVPWWLFAPIVVFASLFFTRYVEGLIIVLLWSAVFAASTDPVSGVCVAIALAVLARLFFEERIRSYV